MKSAILNPAIFLVALSATVFAEVPKKAPLSRYTSLWTNSPFTVKPPDVGPGEENNPLDDYALIGVSPISNSGFRVTLINKKQPDERIMVESGTTKEGFSIVGVDRKAGDPLGTAVRMKSGSVTGVVKFDEKLLTLVAPAAPPQQPVLQPGQQPQPQVQQGQQPQQAQNQRQPRPRVVPPPPQAAGAQQPQQQNQRPERRRN